MSNATNIGQMPAKSNSYGKRPVEGPDGLAKKRPRLTDHNVAAITTQEADSGTALEVDILILDHLAYQATQGCLASRSKTTTNVSSPGRILAAFDSFHTIFRARHPQYKPDDELRFRVLLLKLVVLYTQRLTLNFSTPSLESLQALRRNNRERAARWSGNSTPLSTGGNVQVSQHRIPETPRRNRARSAESSASYTTVKGAPTPTKPTPGSQPFTWEEDNALLDGIRLKLSVSQTLLRFKDVLNRKPASCRARRRHLLHKYGGDDNVEAQLAEIPGEEESEDEVMEDVPSPDTEPAGLLPDSVGVTTPILGGPDFYCFASDAQILSSEELEANRALVLETLEAPAEDEKERPFYGTPASVALLDLLPLFMEVSAARTAMSDANLTDTWMQLAGEFMMWACFESAVVRGVGEQALEDGGDTVDVCREAFFWGYHSIDPEDRSEQEILAMFTAYGIPNEDFPDGQPLEDPAWTATKRNYLSVLLPKAPTTQGRKLPWSPTDPAPPTATELLARVNSVWGQYHLQAFEHKMLQFLTALAGSLELPVLTQLESGKLDGMSEEETQGFLKEVCGLREGWTLPRKLRLGES